MNILFIGGAGNHPNANSVCVNNMARVMMRYGHNVWILATGDDYVQKAGSMDGAELWQVSTSYYGKLIKRTAAHPTFYRNFWLRLFSAIRHLAIIATYPNSSPCRAKRVLKKAKELVDNNNILLVVTIFNNFENINAGIELKKMYGDKIRVISYHLDLRTASLNSSSFIRSYVRKRAISSIIRESHVVDKMLIPYSGQSEMEKVDGVTYEKITYVGFPVFINSGESDICALPFEDDCINISYIGTLSVDNRDPRPFLNAIESVIKITKKKIIIHFWGDMGGLLSAIDSSPVAEYHGKIENRYVRHLMSHSDFLLNIGNAIAFNMLPSKTFSMFATGKPIINIITHPKDATLPFFEQYHHSIDIRQYDKNEDIITKLSEGIKSILGKPLRNVDGLFDDFKPETICNLILEP